MHIDTFRTLLENALFRKRQQIDLKVRDRIVRNCLLSKEDEFELKNGSVAVTAMYMDKIIQDKSMPNDIKIQIKSLKYDPEELIRNGELKDMLEIQQAFTVIKHDSKNESLRVFGIISTINSLFKYEVERFRIADEIVKRIHDMIKEMNMWFVLDKGVQHSQSMDSLVTSILKLEFFGALKKRLHWLAVIDPFEETKFFVHTTRFIHFVAQYILEMAILERTFMKLNDIFREMTFIEQYIVDIQSKPIKNFKKAMNEIERTFVISLHTINEVLNDISIDVLSNQDEGRIMNMGDLSNSFEAINGIAESEFEIAKRIIILDRQFQGEQIEIKSDVEDIN